MRNRKYLSLPWVEWYILAKQYYIKHHHLIVPTQFETSDGYKLGRWIERQRRLYNTKSHVLVKSRIEQLEEIGMVWKLEYRYDWEYWIDICKSFYEQHGHLNIAKKYKKDGISLGEWLHQQRKDYHLGTLPKDRQKALESLHIQWNIRKRQDWNTWYAIAKQYYIKHGDLNVKVEYVDEYGNKLGIWIYMQREKYRHKRYPALDDEQIRKLNDIHIKW